MKNQIVQLTKKLISFRSSELYPSQKKACLDFIERYFKDNNVFVKKIINKNCMAILISNTKSNSPDLLLNGHIDVIDGEDYLFKLRVTDNKLYGRGAIDMKASVAIMMVLMKQIIREKNDQKITLMIVGDEEIPGPKSTEYLLRNLRLKPKFTIVGEETGLDIVVQQKGSLNLKIKAFGKTVHSAFPERGVNAIEKCLAFYREISDLQCFQKKSGYRNTIAITYLQGGQAINSIPDICEMGVNIRFVAKKDLQRILNFVKRRRRVDFSIDTYYSNSIMKSIGCESEIRKLRAIAKSIGNIKVKTRKTATGSDAKFFSEQKLPVIMFGPKGKDYHEDSEYVEIDSLINYYKILYEFINKQNHYQWS